MKLLYHSLQIHQTPLTKNFTELPIYHDQLVCLCCYHVQITTKNRKYQGHYGYFDFIWVGCHFSDAIFISVASRKMTSSFSILHAKFWLVVFCLQLADTTKGNTRPVWITEEVIPQQGLWDFFRKNRQRLPSTTYWCFKMLIQISL